MNKYVGVLYPIKDENGNTVDYKPVTNAVNCDSHAGIIISLSDKLPSILVGYSVMEKLLKGEKC